MIFFGTENESVQARKCLQRFLERTVWNQKNYSKMQCIQSEITADLVHNMKQDISACFLCGTNCM